MARLRVAFLFVVGTIGAGLLYLLGYVSRHMAANGTLSFTIRSNNGWKYWLPGFLLAW